MNSGNRFVIEVTPKIPRKLIRLEELAKRWKPELSDGFKKHNKHEALADIRESIEELKYYRENFIRP